MAKSPNMKPANNNWSVSASWTQPYLPNSYNPFYEPSPKHVATEELIKLAAIDSIVDAMLTYPAAEAIINKITKETKK
jgi:hypothetical protein|tara:strand:+ start:10 stop:243 length:234 start_codon:yes stop_codon:yes gene_type:complete